MTRDMQPVRTRTIAALLAGLMMGGTTASYAQENDAPASPGTASTAADAPRNGDNRADRDMRGGRNAERGEMRGGGRHGGRRGEGRMGGRLSPSLVASTLSTAETGLGITSDQMEAWQAFSNAAIAFVEVSGRPDRGERRGPGEPDGQDAGAGSAAGADARDSLQTPESVSPTPPPADATRPDETSDGSAVTSSSNADQPSQLRAFRMLDRIADQAIARGDAARTLKTAMSDLEAVLTPEQIETAQTLFASMMRDGRGGRHGERGGGRGERR